MRVERYWQIQASPDAIEPASIREVADETPGAGEPDAPDLRRDFSRERLRNGAVKFLNATAVFGGEPRTSRHQKRSLAHLVGVSSQSISLKPRTTSV
jgi:hypothetical protein